MVGPSIFITRILDSYIEDDQYWVEDMIDLRRTRSLRKGGGVTHVLDQFSSQRWGKPIFEYWGMRRHEDREISIFIMTNRTHDIILRIESPIYDSSSLDLESGLWGRSWYIKEIFFSQIRDRGYDESVASYNIKNWIADLWFLISHSWIRILRSIMIYEINFHKAVTHWRNFPKAVDSEVYHNIWKKYFIRLLFSREREK